MHLCQQIININDNNSKLKIMPLDKGKYGLFRKHYKILLKKDFIESDQWLDWFVGFSEGDGCLFTSVKNNRCYFILTQKEISILNHIKDVFDFGNVKLFNYNNKSVKTKTDIIDFGRWTCYDKKLIVLLYLIFNGNLYLKSKNTDLNNWYNILMNSPLSRLKAVGITSLNLIPIFNPKLNKPKLYNSLLSGFIDAEGCFTISFYTSEKVAVRFILDQAEEEILLNNIGILFSNKPSVYLRKTKGKDIYRLSIDCNPNWDRYDNIINYFETFPLKSNKLNNYIYWSQVKDVYLMNKDKDFILKIKPIILALKDSDK